MKRTVTAENAPKAIGPYAQGIAAGNFIFFSGQIPLDPVSGVLTEGGIIEQTRQVLKNIDALLKSQNLTARDVVKTTVFITDMNHFALLNAEYANYFNSEPPARSCVQVAALPKNALVEIEVIAYKA